MLGGCLKPKYEGVSERSLGWGSGQPSPPCSRRHTGSVGILKGATVLGVTVPVLSPWEEPEGANVEVVPVSRAWRGRRTGEQPRPGGLTHPRIHDPCSVGLPLLPIMLGLGQKP